MRLKKGETCVEFNNGEMIMILDYMKKEDYYICFAIDVDRNHKPQNKFSFLRYYEDENLFYDINDPNIIEYLISVFEEKNKKTIRNLCNNPDKYRDRTEEEKREERDKMGQIFAVALVLGLASSTTGQSGEMDGPILGITSTMATSAGIYGSTADGGIEIWQDSFGNWHVNDNNDKNKVDKAAEVLYNRIKGKETKNYELVVENKQSAEAMKKLLETKDKQEMINKLTALEELLIESSVDQYESKERIIKKVKKL